uniref:Uncharacterized protein n=1 Tax=Bionectria ochroleuca TaxID=29856 RepID=A0A8H7ND64_BIOOC
MVFEQDPLRQHGRPPGPPGHRLPHPQGHRPGQRHPRRQRVRGGAQAAQHGHGDLHAHRHRADGRGASSTHERRCVDDTWREHEDWLFGKVKGRTRWVSLAEVDDEFLKKDWEEEKVGEDGKNFILSEVESVGNGWTATQIWGFQKIEGERRYVRHVVVKKEDKTEVVKLVYDYTGQ